MKGFIKDSNEFADDDMDKNNLSIEINLLHTQKMLKSLFKKVYINDKIENNDLLNIKTNLDNVNKDIEMALAFLTT